MTVVYTESDADLTVLDERKLAVIGYGALGRSVALNLRDSGLSPLVGEANEVRAGQAREDGFECLAPNEAAHLTDTRLLMLPDEVLPELYLAHISPELRAGDMLVFASGYSLAFGFVEPPPFVDAVMITPRTTAAGLREAFLDSRHFLSFIAVEQDSSGHAWERLLALARALGALRAGALELTFQQEAELRLFVQQTVLPALHHLLFTAADLLTKEGYPAEAALLDMYISGELGEMLSQAAQHGLMDTIVQHTLTAQYGILSRIERFQDTKLRRQLEIALEEIRTGRFSQEWSNEYHNGYPRLLALRERRQAQALWRAEQAAIELRRRATPREP